MSENLGLYYWAVNFVTTRSFGWTVPHTWCCPLMDMFNHSDWAHTQVDLIHTKLHLANNKIYMHPHNFEAIIRNARDKAIR